MTGATAFFYASTAVALAACVPALPGSALGGGAGGSEGSVTIAGASEFVFVGNAGLPRNLAVDSSYVYWANTNLPALMKVRVDGGAGPTVLAPLLGIETWVAVDGQNVYWSDGAPYPTTIFKMALTGGAPTALATSPGAVRELVVNGAAVYWTSAETVMKVDLAGGAPAVLAQGGFSFDIAVDDRNVYWSGGDSPSYFNVIAKVSVSGGAPVELVRGPFVLNFRSDSMFLYWLDGNLGGLMRMGVDGGVPELAFPVPGGTVSLAIDSSGVYWADPNGTVFAGVLASQSQRTIGNTGSLPASAVTTDAKNVYWVGAVPGGAIMKARK
jgi:hypothetical protein